MIKVRWIDGMKFYAVGDSGHGVLLDTSPDVGGDDTAARPMEFFLFSLGGCTGMDVVSILQKMRVKPDEFWMEIASERRQEHPKYYTDVKIVYHFRGRDLPREKIEKAVNLSQNRYCSVSAMIKKFANLSYEIVLHEDGE